MACLWEGVWESFYLQSQVLRGDRQVRLLLLPAWADTQGSGELFQGENR